MGTFRHNGVKIRGNAFGELSRCEVSLPKLHFGFNGRLIASQSEYRAALMNLRGVLDEFAEVPELVSWPNPSRLDLVWQFDIGGRLGLPGRNLMLAHSGICLLNRMRLPQLRPGSLTWEGKRFELQLYCKSLKGGRPDEVLRVEMRFKNSAEAAKRLSGDWHDFDALWQAYRETMRIVPQIHTPTGKGGFAESMGRILPREEREKVFADLSHRSDRAMREYRRKADLAEANLPAPFSWLDWLPAEGPPRLCTSSRNQTTDSER